MTSNRLSVRKSGIAPTPSLSVSNIWPSWWNRGHRQIKSNHYTPSEFVLTSGFDYDIEAIANNFMNGHQKSSSSIIEIDYSKYKLSTDPSVNG